VTDRERQKAFDRAQRERLRAQTALMRNAQTEIDRLMRVAIGSIRNLLSEQPSDYQRWSLPQVELQIRRALDVFSSQAATVATDAQRVSWDGGQALVEAPLAAARVQVVGVAPLVTQEQLQALTSFMTGRIRDVTIEAANLINTQLALVTLGAQTPFEATKSVAGILKDKSLERARRIVRTELGRAFSVATQARMTAAASQGVEMDKVWRRSGKAHQRPNHALADGQRVAHDQPFEIISKDGEVIRMMYPRDPKAPAGETINCGCTAIPKVRGWTSTSPDKVPFSESELALNPKLREIVGKNASRK
jgi:hypothetical protein